MSSPLYLLLYSDGFYSTVLQYITLPYQVYRVLQGANAPFAAKVVVFVKHTMITYIEVQCCTVDDTVYTVKYCKKNKQTYDNMWLYVSRMTRRPSGGGRQQTAGSMSPRMHNCHDFLCLHDSVFSITVLCFCFCFLLYLTSWYCNVQY